MKNEIIFVYNADSGLFSSVTDFAHKLISPGTYNCQLCALTYGNFTMKKEWKSFIQDLNYPVSFLYKDEFEKKFQHNYAVPAVFMRNDKAIIELVSKKQIDNCNTLDDLKTLVTNKIQADNK